MIIWFVVSFGFGILLVEPLNAISLGGYKLGFWFAQQGSIYVFVVLIFVYALRMNRSTGDSTSTKTNQEPPMIKICKPDLPRRRRDLRPLHRYRHLGTAATTGDFYVAGNGVHPVANGMATAADWMSAASFISMAGLIAFKGYDASVYLMGWTGGYVLLAMLLAPYLRKFGKFTVPEFIGDRYYSKTARLVAVICLIVASLTYVIGQMKGVGVAFSRFLEVDFDTGVIVGMGIVFIYAVLGGMKGITYTQIAQYVVLIFAYTVPAIFISLQLTGNPMPQLGLGSEYARDGGQRHDPAGQAGPGGHRPGLRGLSRPRRTRR